MNELNYMLYDLEPDYSRPLFELPPEARERMFNRLYLLYGKDEAKTTMPELERILRVFCAHKTQEMIDAEKSYDSRERFTEQDLILITYGDLLLAEEDSPLTILHKVVNAYNPGAFNTLHILPFFPYSSDRGFSIKDFRTVDPRLGTWKDIRKITSHYRRILYDELLVQIFLSNRPCVNKCTSIKENNC